MGDDWGDRGESRFRDPDWDQAATDETGREIDVAGLDIDEYRAFARRYLGRQPW